MIDIMLLFRYNRLVLQYSDVIVGQFFGHQNTDTFRIFRDGKSKYRFFFLTVRDCTRNQGTNARKVISDVYAFFVLQCTVFGRKSKHKTNVTA